jgi:hypothetical protein
MRRNKKEYYMDNFEKKKLGYKQEFIKMSVYRLRKYMKELGILSIQEIEAQGADSMVSAIMQKYDEGKRISLPGMPETTSSSPVTTKVKTEQIKEPIPRTADPEPQVKSNEDPYNIDCDDEEKDLYELTPYVDEEKEKDPYNINYDEEEGPVVKPKVKRKAKKKEPVKDTSKEITALEQKIDKLLDTATNNANTLAELKKNVEPLNSTIRSILEQVTLSKEIVEVALYRIFSKGAADPIAGFEAIVARAKKIVKSL